MNFKDIKPEHIENAIGYALLEDILQANNFLTLSEKKAFIAMFSKTDALNENLIGRIKDGVKKLRQLGGVIKDEALQKIEQLAGKAQDFADWMATALSGLAERSLGFFKAKFDRSKQACLDKVKKHGTIAKDKTSTLRKEMDQLKETTVFWSTDFPKMIAEKVKSLFSKYLVKESLQHVREAHDDKKHHQHADFGFVTKATEALLKFPPFNLLASVHEYSSLAAEKIMFLFSQLTAKIGGPGIYRWVILPFVLGAFIETHLEGKIHHFMDDMIEKAFESETLLKLLPGVRQVLEVVGYVAMFVTIVEVCQSIIDAEEKEDELNSEHKPVETVAGATHSSDGKKLGSSVNQAPPKINNPGMQNPAVA